MANAFPWLFPGGVGDYWESGRGEPDNPRKWAEHLIRLFNGQHERDAVFAFYVLNKIRRKENNSSGGFFLQKFLGDAPDTLESLLERIDANDTTFIQKLQYFAKKIRGSDAYWRDKKWELRSWINHHV